MAKALQQKGYHVKSDKDFFAQCGSGNPVELDMACVQKNLGDNVIFESHTAHLIDCELVIQLKCSDYAVLRDRLTQRGYDSQKVQDNVDAEIFDVIGDEVECDAHVVIETKGLSILDVVERVESAICKLKTHKLYKDF